MKIPGKMTIIKDVLCNRKVIKYAQSDSEKEGEAIRFPIPNSITEQARGCKEVKETNKEKGSTGDTMKVLPTPFTIVERIVQFVAVFACLRDVAFGLWDRMSFVLEEINKEKPANTNSTKCDVDVKTDVEPAEQDVLVASKHVSKGCAGITLEDVLTFAKEYFMFSNQVLDNISSHPRKQSVFLREICKLECSLTQHFSADDFASLGFGDIFTFLGEHISLLPTTWQDCLTRTDKVEKPSVKVCMSQTDLLTNLSKNGDHVSLSIVLFSSTLSDFRAKKGFSDTHVGTNDVIELLLKAPMLVDLSLWSCWDYKFTPSLGPLVGWLLSNVTTKELFCFVTKDGKVLCLDHSATLDSFLESFLRGSSFETAVKLISLIALYGGERNVPLTLLKFHANFDFEGTLVASRFVLDCLGYIPKEFQRFRAELLVPTLRSVIKDAQLAILSECKSKEDHMLIHELGLSLGIEKSIIVLNNEQGFSAENIRALCDVGNSTKKKASSGYIGKKGI
nr:hypothetical protein [Tanacetum cinerariifolium]